MERIFGKKFTKLTHATMLLARGEMVNCDLQNSEKRRTLVPDDVM